MGCLRLALCDPIPLIVHDEEGMCGKAIVQSDGKIVYEPPKETGEHRAYDITKHKESKEGGRDPILLVTPAGAYVIRGNNEETEKRLTDYLRDEILKRTEKKLYVEHMKIAEEHYLLLLEPLLLIDVKEFINEKTPNSEEELRTRLEELLAKELERQCVPEQDIKALAEVAADPHGPGSHFYLKFGTLVISRVLINGVLSQEGVKYYIDILGSMRFHRYKSSDKKMSLKDLMKLYALTEALTFYHILCPTT